MFKSLGRFFAKQALPLIISNLSLDIDTVEKTDGYYLRIRVEVFDFKLLDELIKLSSQSSKDLAKKETLTLDAPIDVIRANQIDRSQGLINLSKNY